MPDHIVHHIPVCPFSQRLEILLALKGATDAVSFRVVDHHKAPANPRPAGADPRGYHRPAGDGDASGRAQRKAW